MLGFLILFCASPVVTLAAPHHFSWSVSQPFAFVGEPFPVALSARTATGDLDAAFNGSVALRGYSGSTVVITEIDSSDIDRVEFMNVSAAPVDMSGWQISLYDNSRWPAPRTTYVLPAGTRALPGHVFVLTDGVPFPGAWPTFHTATNLLWDVDASRMAVLLRNELGGIIDFVVVGDGTPEVIHEPSLILPSHWSGPALPPLADPTRSYQRRGSVDRHEAGDWNLAPPTVGITNGALSIPFAGAGLPVALSPAQSGVFTNGFWAGALVIAEPQPQAYLVADDGQGHLGTSGLFPVRLHNDVSLAAAVQPAPAIVDRNVHVTLIVSNSGPTSATGLFLTNQLPEGVAVRGVFVYRGACGVVDGHVRCDLDDLSPGEAHSIHLVLAPDQVGIITNRATLVRSENDSYLPNNTIEILTPIQLAGVSISDSHVTEGAVGTAVNLTFPVTLSAPSLHSVSMQFELAPGSATPGSDYEPGSGSVTFSPGQTNQNITVIVHGDGVGEAHERFAVQLTNLQGARLLRSQAYGEIQDDDPPSNDAFSARAQLVGGALSFSGFTANATGEAAEIALSGITNGKTLWWTWTSADSGSVTLSAEAGFAVKVGVYTNLELAELNLVAANEPWAPRASVTFEAVAGVAYQIALTTSSDSGGTVAMTLEQRERRPFQASSHLRREAWDTDGIVYAMAVTNEVVYLGGQFDYVAPRGAQLLSLDRYTGAAEPDFPSIVGGVINAVVSDGAGGWFIGGDFPGVGGVDHAHLVRVRRDLSVDGAFQPKPNGAVSALAFAEGNLYVAGDFSVIGGVSRRGIAALEVSTGTVLPWDPEANGRVTQIRVRGELVYVAGYFTQIGRQARGRLAALDRVSGTATGWNPSLDGAVLAFELQDDRVFVGGSFSSVGGVLRNNLASVELGSGLPTWWTPNAQGGAVTALQLDCDRVYAGGYFDLIGGLPRQGLAAIDVYSGQPTDWQPSITSEGPAAGRAVLSLGLVGGVLYAGGEFDQADGLARRDLAAFDVEQGAILPWAPNPDGGVSLVQIIGGKVFAGFLKSPGGVTRHNLAAFDLITGRVLEWAPNPNNAVHAVALGEQALFVGGAFTNIGGVRRDSLAAVSLSSHELLPWNPSANDAVLALACLGNTLYAGGRFTLLNGASRLRIGELDVSNGTLSTWDPSADSSVQALAVANGLVYVGGNFNSIGGQIRPFLAAVERSTGSATSWRPAMNNLVETIAVGPGDIFVGGRFTTAGGILAQRIAALDPFTAAVRANRFHADGEVRALQLVDGILYVGGYFSQVNGFPRLSCAAANAATGELTAWNPGLSSVSQVECIEVGQQTLFVGGRKLRLDPEAGENSWAMFPRTGAPLISHPTRHYHAAAGTSMVIESAVTGQEPFLYQWHFQGVPIDGATHAVLALTNVSPLQVGVYTLVASNILGVAASDVTVHVTQPVQLLAQPEGATVLPGSNVVLSVQASGSPIPIYQWRLNGANIPGAVYSVLTLTNIQVTDAGRYDVVAANRHSAVVSAPAFVAVATPILAFADTFAARGTNSSRAGIGSGNNTNASQELGETNVLATLGGNSVWYSWRAPADGIATFYTRGSDFDTLLSVYTGSAVASLGLVAADDDSGGYLSSLVSFNAVAGVSYVIAVDGYAGQKGRFIFGWQLDETMDEVPHILQHPSSQSVSLHAAATFHVAAIGAPPLRYQWFRGCLPLLNATNPVLVVNDVTSEDLGEYRVQITSPTGRAAVSQPANLEVGPLARVFTVDKVENLLFRTPFAPPIGVDGDGGGFTSVSVGFISVSVGSIVSQTFNNVGSQTQPGEPDHCSVLGGASKWLGLTPTADGMMIVDTTGSAIDTFLAVYRATNLLNLASGLIACDDNGAPDGVRSLARFPVSAGTPYLIVVDGVHGERGVVEINWGLGLVPQVNNTVYTPVIRQGNELRLEAGLLSAVPPASFQWRLNNVNLPHATNQTYVVSEARSQHGGIYSVVVSNFAGTVIQDKAVVVIDIPLQLFGLGRGNRNEWHFSIDGNIGQRYRLQVSDNLSAWRGIMTNQLFSPPVSFTDPDSSPVPRRFYLIEPLAP